MPSASANPFRFGSPVSGEFFTGREAEARALVDHARNTINVSLMSPRRYGKTSLLIRAERTLIRARIPVVHVDVLLCSSPGGFASALATGLLHAQRPLTRRGSAMATEVRRRFRVVPSIEINDAGHPVFSFVPGLAPRDAETVLADVYRILGEDSPPGVLVLDEFDALPDLGRHFPAQLKGLADVHPNVCLVVAGSRRRMMERLVHVHGAPLYGMTSPISLGPIEEPVMRRHLVKRSEAGGKTLTDPDAERIMALSGPAPNDIQKLAYAAFNAAAQRIDEAAITAGLDQTIRLNAATYAAQWSALPSVQRRVLAELAVHPTSEPFGRDFTRRTGLATSSVQRAIAALDDAELIIDDQGRWRLTDPFVARWAATAHRTRP